MLIRLSLLSALFNAATTATATGSTTRILEDDFSWMSGYSVKYQNCFRTDNVVSFRLCPADNTCDAGCADGGDYLVDLSYFVDAFTEAQLGAREYRCEMARENCDYDDDGLCYSASNLDYCSDANEDDNGFDLQEWLECTALDDDDGAYYVGPYCSEDNYNLYLGVFTDEDCTAQVEDVSSFETKYGFELPYSSESIVGDECANCNEHALEEDKDDEDADDEDDVLEQCEDLYGESSRCDWTDSSACDHIQELQSEEDVTVGNTRSTGVSSSSRKGVWVGFLVAALILGCCGLGYYMKTKRDKEAAGLSGAKENLV